jgi:hypothetical protein
MKILALDSIIWCYIPSGVPFRKEVAEGDIPWMSPPETLET